MTPQKQYDILRSVQLIGVMAQMIEIEFHSHLVEANFRNPMMEVHAKEIKLRCQQILNDLVESGVNIKCNDTFTEEYATNMYEIFETLATFEAEKIIEYNEGLKKITQQLT